MAYNRQHVLREARPCGQEVYLKLCRPRQEADAAVHVKEAQIAARDPVPAQIRSLPKSIYIGETESASRNVSPRPRCRRRQVLRSPGAAIVTEVGPG